MRSRLQAAAARGLSGFVGRAAEVALILRALEQARQGRGQIVAVVGEPGVGKSRLVLELTHSPRVEGWLVLEAGAVPYGKATSYLPIVDLLKGYFRIGGRDTPGEARAKVTGKILDLDRALEATIPALLALLEVGDDPQWQALDPPERRQRTLEAVKRLLLREALVQPLLVVFQDLHWIDPETQALLDSLVESLTPARLLLLVNYRPEYEQHWGSKAAYTQLRLDPLPPEGARDLLRGLLGEDVSVTPLGPVLIERTEGNPFFLEESVRALVETKVLAGERGAYRLIAALSDVQVPPTVQTILAARIDRLPPAEKRLLQSAAVIGKDVPFALLAAIADEPDAALRHGLARLQAAELLYETRLFPDLEHTFKHALTHEVAYRSVLKDRRRELHARTVEAIEQRHGDLLGEHVERLSDHAVRGEVWDKAAAYASRAGIRAADRSAHARTAKAFFDTALEAMGHLPESRETLAHGIEVRRQLGSALFTLGEREALLQSNDEALALAERLGDDEFLASVLGARTSALWYDGDLPRALEAGTRAVALATAGGHRVNLIHACLNLGLVCQTMGDSRGALARFAQAVELLRDGLERERMARTLYPSVLARNELAAAHEALGQFDTAAAIHEDALRLADDLGHSTTVLTARLEACEGLVRRAAFAEAIPRLEAVIQALRDASLLVWAVSGSAMLGYSLAMTGRLPEGIALLRDALEQTAQGRRTHETHWMAHLCEAYLLGGQVAEARELAERALRLSRERTERGTEARVLCLLGAIAAQSDGRGDGSEAARHYAAAMALAVELGSRPLVARCHLGLGQLHRRTAPAVAREHLTGAVAMLRDMGMRCWLEEAETELAALG